MSPPSLTSTTCVSTAESSVSNTVGGNVSYSQENGTGVGVSASVTYENSESITCPAVMISELGGDFNGPNSNNWQFGTFNISLGKTNFIPTTQWIWEEPRKEGQTLFSFQTSIQVSFYQVSCFPGASPFPLKGTYSINLPVPPTPIQCTTNSDCSTARVCATDLTPSVCVPQPCDEMMTCPGGFQCLNEVCEPDS